LNRQHLNEAIEDFNEEEYRLSPHIYLYDDIWPIKKYDIEKSV